MKVLLSARTLKEEIMRNRALVVLVALFGLMTSGCLLDGAPGVSQYERDMAQSIGISLSDDDVAFMETAEAGLNLSRYAVDGLGVPYYNGGRPGCSWTDAQIIRQEFQKKGGSLEDQVRAVYTAGRESGCGYWVHYRNSRSKDDSYCAAQLNTRAGWFLPGQPLEAYDPAALLSSMQTCAEAFATAWAACGWAPWNRGSYGCYPGSW